MPENPKPPAPEGQRRAAECVEVEPARHPCHAITKQQLNMPASISHACLEIVQESADVSAVVGDNVGAAGSKGSGTLADRLRGVKRERDSESGPSESGKAFEVRCVLLEGVGESKMSAFRGALRTGSERSKAAEGAGAAQVPSEC